MPPRSRDFLPRRSHLAALLLLLSVPAWAPQPARADSYLPLTVGNHWEYASADGRHEIQRISGTKELNGRTVYVKRYEESTSNEGLENYWIEEPDGRLLLCGFFIADTANWGVVYEPPLCLVDAPLSAGKTWLTTLQGYTVPAMEPVGPSQVRFEVLTAGDVATPAGTFFAYGVSGPQLVPAPLAGRSASGEKVGANASRASGMPAEATPTDWYSPGVGVVQYAADAVYLLVGYGFPTPVAASSWGRLKSLYR